MPCADRYHIVTSGSGGHFDLDTIVTFDSGSGTWLGILSGGTITITGGQGVGYYYITIDYSPGQSMTWQANATMFVCPPESADESWAIAGNATDSPPYPDGTIDLVEIVRDDMPVSSYHDLVLSHGPKVFYELDDKELTTIVSDSSGNGFNGNVSGDISFEQSSIIVNEGQSAYFNGGYISIPLTAFNTITSITVECWIVPATDDNDQRIFDFNNGITGFDAGKYFFCSTKHHDSGKCRVAFSLAGLNADVLVDSIHLEPNSIYHVVSRLYLTSDNSKLILDLYINGIQYGPVSTSPGDWVNLRSSLQNAWISKSPWSVDPYYIGKKDEFAIYPRALLESEILAHYNLGITGEPPPGQIYEQTTSDALSFFQNASGTKEASGGGRTFSVSVSDHLTFGDTLGKNAPSLSVRDTVNFVDSNATQVRPFHSKVSEQVVFNESIHGSPFRIIIADTLAFQEIFRPNLTKLAITDTLTFNETLRHNRLFGAVDEGLTFTESLGVQNNHQTVSENLDLTEGFNGHKSTINISVPDDFLAFNESQDLHWHVANLTVSDVLVFQDQFHRNLSAIYNDTVIFSDYIEHVFPVEITDTLVLTEVISEFNGQVISETLTFIEVFCVLSNLNRPVIDALSFVENFATLINGPDDPRNFGIANLKPNADLIVGGPIVNGFAALRESDSQFVEFTLLHEGVEFLQVALDKIPSNATVTEISTQVEYQVLNTAVGTILSYSLNPAGAAAIDVDYHTNTGATFSGVFSQRTTGTYTSANINGMTATLYFSGPDQMTPIKAKVSRFNIGVKYTIPTSTGITTHATYKKSLFDLLQFRETVITDPAPVGHDCVTDIS